jgi:hypothetical protein
VQAQSRDLLTILLFRVETTERSNSEQVAAQILQNAHFQSSMQHFKFWTAMGMKGIDVLTYLTT